MKKYLVILLLLISSTVYAYDCESSYAPSFCANLKHTWNEGVTDVYVPVWIWHNRADYDDGNIKKYNELPWGFGVGKHYYDQDGDLHQFYTMAFLDSHKDIEPIAGYGYQKMFSSTEHLKFGLGYTAFITAREDLGHYIPFPAALPVWSIQYKRFSIQQTYVPGGHNNGNVLFTWFRVEL